MEEIKKEEAAPAAEVPVVETQAEETSPQAAEDNEDENYLLKDSLRFRKHNSLMNNLY